MKQYRIFENDVGANGYSCWAPAKADDAESALKQKHIAGVRCMAVLDDPESLLRYGPDGQTGALPPEVILNRGRKTGAVAGPKRFES